MVKKIDGVWYKPHQEWQNPISRQAMGFYGQKLGLQKPWPNKSLNTHTVSRGGSHSSRHFLSCSIVSNCFICGQILLKMREMIRKCKLSKGQIMWMSRYHLVQLFEPMLRDSRSHVNLLFMLSKIKLGLIYVWGVRLQVKTLVQAEKAKENAD